MYWWSYYFQLLSWLSSCVLNGFHISISSKRLRDKHFNRIFLHWRVQFKISTRIIWKHYQYSIISYVQCHLLVHTSFLPYISIQSSVKNQSCSLSSIVYSSYWVFISPHSSFMWFSVKYFHWYLQMIIKQRCINYYISHFHQLFLEY